MALPILNLSTLPNLAAIVIEENSEKLSCCMRAFAKNKEQVQIVTNEQSLPLHKGFQNVRTSYDPNKVDCTRGTTFVFDGCFADDEWLKDAKLRDIISYPRMYGLTSVFGFRHFPALSSRMCWNLDLLCIGQIPSQQTREQVYDNFFLYHFSYNEFCDFLDKSTKENGFLVLRREGTEDRLYLANP